MTVLIADDDDTVLTALSILLRSEGIECLSCRSSGEAIEIAGRVACALAIVDMNYRSEDTSGQEGLRLIAELRARNEELSVIAMTGWGSIALAVEAMQRGAVDFIEKPWRDNTRLLNVIRTHLKLSAAQRRERHLAAENALLREAGDATEIVSGSSAMQQMLTMARRIAASDLPVLITGENGTGKSLLARFIHRHSSRAAGPYISVNMGALAETTFESEMFGHTKGAFTDAKTDRVGRVELADKGTLFMDEIANLPLTQQAKILRLLEERQYEKLGSSRTRSADIRFVAATNADLDELIGQRGFRQDLLYRLNGVTLHVPPLRERPADVRLLAERFLEQSRRRYNSPVRGFSPGAVQALERYAWPGNVRELQHVVERSVLLAQQQQILEEDLLLSPRTAPAAHIDELSGMTLEQAEGCLIRQTLERHGGNAAEAAKALGISRSALYRRLGRTGPS